MPLCLPQIPLKHLYQNMPTPSYCFILYRRAMTLLGMVLLLSSCAGFDQSPSTAAPPVSPKELKQVSELKQWTLIGKVGIRTSDEASSAIINWSQQQNHFDIFLSGPLGQGSTRIQGRDGNVSMYRNGEDPLWAESPEELLYKSLGWQLPISELKYWIRGIAAPGSPVTHQLWHDNGTTQALQQQGWHIEYSRYQRQQQLPLPSRLIITRDSIKLTFIIKKWQLTP